MIAKNWEIDIALEDHVITHWMPLPEPPQIESEEAVE